MNSWHVESAQCSDHACAAEFAAGSLQSLGAPRELVHDGDEPAAMRVLSSLYNHGLEVEAIVLRDASKRSARPRPFATVRVDNAMFGSMIARVCAFGAVRPAVTGVRSALRGIATYASERLTAGSMRDTWSGEASLDELALRGACVVATSDSAFLWPDGTHLSVLVSQQPTPLLSMPPGALKRLPGFAVHHGHQLQVRTVESYQVDGLAVAGGQQMSLVVCRGPSLLAS